MVDGILAGIRVLVIGSNGEEAESVRAALTAAGSAGVDVVPSVEQVAPRAARARPQAVISLTGVDPLAVRANLDPLGLDAGPPVMPVGDLVPLDAVGARRLALVLEHKALRGRVAELETIVATQVLSAFRDTEAGQLETLRRLALAAEYRDDNSREHTQRVGALAARLARHLGEDDRKVRLVRQAAPLHDLGKIAVPDSILLKPGRLSGDEYEVVKTHAALGARVLAEGSSPLLAVAERVARSHHERWDGDGYPDGLTGDAIPLEARVVHVADVFDVLHHERPYKDAWTVAQAAAEIRAGAGTQFDPDVVAAFDALGAGGWVTGQESS
jgi:HD-GYP domain-containing protein (c-di-GMP phosphodiesterase class II)